MKNVQQLLQPQERLDNLITATFRRFGPRTVDLSYANPHEGPDQVVRDVLEKAARETTALDFQYGPYGGRTLPRRLIADNLRREYGLPFEFRDVIMTPGAMAALNIVLRGLFDSEDEILVLTPCWLDYPLYLRNLDIPMRQVPLGPDKHLNLDAIARALRPGTRGILLSQPCCPTGVLYSEEELDGLAETLHEAEQRFGTAIYLISDEVHRKLLWSGQDFHSPLRSHPRSLSIYSFGKALSMQGQRIGYIAVSPHMPERETVRQNLEQWVRVMGYGGPSSLMQRAVCDLLDYVPALEGLALKQETVRRELFAYGYDVCEGEATYFVYVRSPMEDDFAFTELLASRGVLVAPSTLFHERGYVRLSLTEHYESIVAGLRGFAPIPTEIKEQRECLTQH